MESHLMSSVDNKIKTIRALAEISTELIKSARPIVLCHGVSDMLHIGHNHDRSKAREHNYLLTVTHDGGDCTLYNPASEFVRVP